MADAHRDPPWMSCLERSERVLDRPVALAADDELRASDRALGDDFGEHVGHLLMREAADEGDERGIGVYAQAKLVLQSGLASTFAGEVAHAVREEIGRASCRDRVGHYV